MASSVHHFKAAEAVLAKIAGRETEAATRTPPSPETYQLWLETAKVHVALARVALAAEEATTSGTLISSLCHSWAQALA